MEWRPIDDTREALQALLRRQLKRRRTNIPYSGRHIVAADDGWPIQERSDDDE